MVRCLSLWLVAFASSAAFAQAPLMQVPFASSPNSLRPANFQEPIPVEPIPLPPAHAPDGGLFPVCPPPPPAKPWKGSFEVGGNGATGNSEVFNTRTFFIADRVQDNDLLHMDFLYLLSKQDGLTSQNTAIFNARNEIGIDGTPWSYYASTYTDYDEQRDYKFIIGLFGGLGYQVADTDTTKFKVRAGFGVNYKTGGGPGAPDIWEPALNLGYNYRYNFSERSAFISDADYYPSIENGFGDFLLRLRAAYECTLDPATGLFFRVGIFERYDSNPGPGFEKSDLNYFGAIGFNF